MVNLEKFRAMIGMLEGQFETCKLVIKDDGPEAIDALENPEGFKEVGAPSPESGAELCLRKLGSCLNDAVHMYQDCYRILGMESRFAEHVRNDI